MDISVNNTCISSSSSSENEEDQHPSTTDLFKISSLKTKSKWCSLIKSSDTMQDLVVQGVDDQTLTPHDLSAEELERCVQVMVESNMTICTENSLLESYLLDVDPLLIEHIEKILEAATAAIHKAERTAQLATKLTHQESSSSSPRSTGPSVGGSSKTGGLPVLDKGPKVQSSQKIEIAQREIDKLKAGFEHKQRAAEKSIFQLECQIEENELELKDLEERKKEFNHCLGKDQLSAAGEKVINYFEMRNKLDEILIRGFPAKSKNLKIQLDACTAKIRDIGEGLLYVDYEQLVIHYQNVRGNLSDTLTKLTNYKNTNTTYTLMLTLTRHNLKDECLERAKLVKSAKELEKEMGRLVKKEKSALHKINRTYTNILKTENTISKYTAPSVLEYIKHKSQLHEMKKDLQSLQRKIIDLHGQRTSRCLSNKSSKVEISKGLAEQQLMKNKSDGRTRQKPRLYRGSSFWKPKESVDSEI